MNKQDNLKLSIWYDSSEIRIDLNTDKWLAYLRCYKPMNTMKLFIMLSEDRNKGYGSLMLAKLYETLKEQKIPYIESNLAPFRPYTKTEYMQFLSKIGFRQTWRSYIFGLFGLCDDCVVYAKIPNEFGDKFAKEINNRWNLTNKKEYYDKDLHFTHKRTDCKKIL